MKRYKWLIGSLLITVLCGAGWVFVISGSLIPKMKLVILQVSDANKEHLEVLIQLELKNKTPFYFSSDSVFISVYADDLKIIENESAFKVDLPAFGKGGFEIPLIIKVANLKSLSSSDKLGVVDSCNYKIMVSLIETQNVLLPDSFTITQEAYLPLFKFPKVELVSSKIDKLLSKEPLMLVKLKLSNFNPVSITIKDPKYKASFKGNSAALSGNLFKTIHIPPLAQKEITLPLKINFENVFDKAGKIIFKKDELKVVLTLEGEILSPHENIENFKIKTVVNSNLKALLNN